MAFEIIDVPSFTQYVASDNPRSLAKGELTDCLNQVWDNNRPQARKGSSKKKSNSQWTGTAIKGAIDFSKRDDSFFRRVIFLENGKVYFKKSDDSDFDDPEGIYTEITGPSAVSPALKNPLTILDFYAFADKLMVVDGQNRFLYWDGTTASFVLGTNPTSMSTNNATALSEKQGKMVMLDDAGRMHIGAVNDPTDWNSSGTGPIGYGRTAGVKASKVIPYGDDLIVTAQDPKIQLFKTYRLVGIRFYDPLAAGSDTNQYEVKSVNSIAGIIGSSGQELSDDTIGLTPRGFIPLSQAIGKERLSEKDYISYPIRELIQRINFTAASAISSTVDFVRGRYFCAVPLGTNVTTANVLLVYDFLRSYSGYARSGDSTGVSSFHRWSLWTSQAWTSIKWVGMLGAHPHVADELGNLYQLESAEANYADGDSPISYKITTSALGSDSRMIEKVFEDGYVVFTDLSTNETEINCNPILDGEIITENYDSLIEPLKVVKGGTVLKYDSGYQYDALHRYDQSSANEKLVSFKNRGGRSDSIQLTFSTNTTGVSWGVSSVAVQYQAAQFLDKGTQK